MNQKFKTLILWALPILLVIILSYQFLSSTSVDSLKNNGTTVAPRNSAVARVSYGRFLDYINSGRVTSVDIFDGNSTANDFIPNLLQVFCFIFTYVPDAGSLPTRIVARQGFIPLFCRF